MIFAWSKKYLAALTVSGVLFCHFQNVNVSGCGGGWEPTLLEGGGSVILNSAPFFFELEMKELAKQFPSKYKSKPPKEEYDNATYRMRGQYGKQSADADTGDFAKAFPADADAQSRHRAAREFIDGGADGDAPLAAELPGEFADYHRGALLFKRGNVAAAGEEWKNLLARPAKERRWRSTWAAFMLGKIALHEKNYAAAKKFFQQTRKLADDGFADSLALAAASLGWEAKANLEENNDESAARLYLRQLSSGDETAYVSLRVLSGAPPERCAKDPVLRKIFIADTLARNSGPWEMGPPTDERPVLKWLEVFEKSETNGIDDADALAWIAYQSGRFDLAKRWLKFVNKPTGLSLWLRAKLAFRDGDIDEASVLMAKALPLITSDQLPDNARSWGEVTQKTAAQGDLSLYQLANAEFGKAFVSLVKGGFLRDAAYVGERVLSPEELTGLIEQNFPAQKPDVHESRGDLYRHYRTYWLWKNKAAFAREILARRLTRLERFNEAQKYFASDMQERLAKYATAVTTGKNPKKPKEERIKAFTQAAVLSNRDLLGRWTSWWGYWSWDHGGQSENHLESSIYWDRLHGTLGYFSINGRLQKPEKTSPLTLPVSKAERRRLQKFAEPPDIRDYTDYIASEWMWQAAKLMPADDEQTALTLNRSGWLLHGRYDTLPDKFYEEILRRCPNTETGRAVAKKRRLIPR